MGCFYDFLISGLLLRVESPRPLQVPECFQPFQQNSVPARAPDIRIEVLFEIYPTGPDSRWLSGVEAVSGTPVKERFFWRDGEYIVREESAGRGGPCRLFIPPSFAEAFCRQGKWLNYIDMSRLLLPFDRLMLHASAVVYREKAYIFSAPSGTGKSTHAALWEKYYGAKILNGDKVLLHVSPGGCTAYGSPVAGSSGIYCADSAPAAALLMLRQADHDQLTPLPQRRALLELYSEALKSSWDEAFNSRLLELLDILRTTIPAFRLECLPDRSAVECVLQKIEGM